MSILLRTLRRSGVLVQSGRCDVGGGGGGGNRTRSKHHCRNLSSGRSDDASRPGGKLPLDELSKTTPSSSSSSSSSPPSTSSSSSSSGGEANKPEDQGIAWDSVASGLQRAFTSVGQTAVPNEADILIVGGGAIGSSIAYWIKRRAPETFNVMIVDKDPTYRQYATPHSVAGIRQQFALPEFVKMSMFGAEFLRDYKYYLGDDAPDPRFNPESHLFLARTDDEAERMVENVRMQRELGARVEILSRETIQSRFPYIKADDVTLASYGLQNEGWIDPWPLVQGLKQYNLHRQVGYVNGEIVDFTYRQVPNSYVGDLPYETTNHAVVRLADGSTKTIIFCMLIIAAGSESGHVGRLLRMGRGQSVLSVPVPIEPRKEAVYSFHAPDLPVVGFPILTDSNGIYCRREGLGGHFVCGRSPMLQDEPKHDDDLDTVSDDYFKEAILPTLASRVPAFENIQPTHSWIDLCDYNYLDEHPIIGLHPYYHHVWICSGFSGHGLQLAPAVGRAIMERIVDGEFVNINLSRFSFGRVVRGESIYQQDVV